MHCLIFCKELIPLFPYFLIPLKTENRRALAGYCPLHGGGQKHLTNVCEF